MFSSFEPETWSEFNAVDLGQVTWHLTSISKQRRRLFMRTASSHCFRKDLKAKLWVIPSSSFVDSSEIAASHFSKTQTEFTIIVKTNFQETHTSPGKPTLWGHRDKWTPFIKLARCRKTFYEPKFLFRFAEVEWDSLISLQWTGSRLCELHRYK